MDIDSLRIYAKLDSLNNLAMSFRLNMGQNIYRANDLDKQKELQPLFDRPCSILLSKDTIDSFLTLMKEMNLPYGYMWLNQKGRKIFTK